MMRRLSLVALAVFSFLLPAKSQLLDHVQGEVLVQFRPQVSAQQWAKKWQYFEGRPTGLKTRKLVSAPMHIWALTFDFARIHETRFLQAIRRDREVVEAQFNHFVTTRSTIPDDPGFDSQWQYINTGQTGGLPGADIDMDLAWDITTGGLTVQGDTIVVCALDDGIDLNHEDFEDNLWINHAEIPDNDIDDDGNGYVDDYRGWSTVTGTDNISGGGHGTPVAGIMGAKGNNGIGVSGISWNVKVMVVKNNFNTDEAAVLEAYSYPLVQRMRYNETNGEEGAFVVATNASWGVDLGDPEDAPLWCAFYDTLGTNGILNCGATINGNVNVDIQGDLPTACPSDYLISVTNMNHNDVKVTSAGYGLTTIDLGAFGASTWTTDLPNTYGPFGGTSGATPHVTGTIGLLYSAPCPSFIAIAKSDPAAAVLLAKQYILEGVTPNASLDSITVTGGRLNVFNSLQLLMQNCSGCPPATSVNAVDITGDRATISWAATDSVTQVDLLWRPADSLDWDTISGVSSPFLLEGLLACSEYELQITAYCSSDTATLFNNYTFKTDGCCELPQGFQVSEINDTSALATWGNVLAATQFVLQLRPAGDSTWQTIEVAGNSFSLDSLTACTDYEIALFTVCDTLQTAPTALVEFRTSGCGACTDLNYCPANGLDAGEEWIEKVVFAGIDNTSGSDDGYGLYTEITPPVLELGGSYDISLSPAFSGFVFQEYFKVWIDYNQNGDFENDELAFDPGASSNTTVTGAIVVPPASPLGFTRMRVVMNFQNVVGPCNFPNGTFGEVEDYCVIIVPASFCASPANIDTLSVYLTNAELGWDLVSPAISYVIRYRKAGEDLWEERTSLSPGIVLTDLEPCRDYEVQIQTVCGFSQSDTASNFAFHTSCITDIAPAPPNGFHWRVMPNPFTESLRIEIDAQGSGVLYQFKLDVLNALGQVMTTQIMEYASPGRRQLEITEVDWEPGIYFVRLTNQDGVVETRKVIKQ